MEKLSSLLVLHDQWDMPKNKNNSKKQHQKKKKKNRKQTKLGEDDMRFKILTIFLLGVSE